MARTKKRMVDVVAVKLRYSTEEYQPSFVEILNNMNNQEFRYSSDKLFEFRLLNTEIQDCVVGIIVTTQDSDIPPIRHKRTKEFSTVNIDPNSQGLAYANIFIYDALRNILVFEINRNGCFLNPLKEFIYNSWNISHEGEGGFDISFPAVLRSNEYERMLSMGYYKKIYVELLNPTEIADSFARKKLSMAENIIKCNIDAGVKNNANTIVLEQIAINKRVNPLGLSHKMVKNIVDVVKQKLHRENVQKLEVDGYSSDPEEKGVKTIDLLADTFDEFFRIPEIQVQSDVQQQDRKIGIENLYGRILPEIKRITGIL